MNWTKQIQKIYQGTFDLSHIYSTKRNLIEDTSKELNTKAYTMTLKEEEKGKRWHSRRDPHPYIMPTSNLLDVMGSIP